MCIIGFDETHGETWTVDLKKALEINGSLPEYHYYGHIAKIASDTLNCEIRRITEQWSVKTLEEFNVLVIAHPADNKIVKGCGGSPNFTDEEIQMILEFVKQGGGLFVIGEWGISQWESNINDVIYHFGLKFSDHTLLKVRSRGDPRTSYLLARHFICSDLKKHPITTGMSKISYHRGCAIQCDKKANEELIFAPLKRRKTVFAVAQFEQGRVAAIGDSDLFSIPYIGLHDNSVLFVNSIKWLANKKLQINIKNPKSPSMMLKKSAFDLIPIQHKKDLATLKGNHLVDCSAFRDKIENLYSQELPNPYEDLEGFLLEAALKFGELPRSIRKSVIEFRRSGNDFGVLLLKSLPIDPNLPDTPTNTERCIKKKTFFSEFWLSVFGEAIGEPVSFAQEHKGEIFQNIIPTQQKEETLSSESSKILLDFHTETAFHPFLPDFLFLYCLRSDHEHTAKTLTASTKHILPLIPLKYRALLLEDIFKTGIDPSFGGGKKGAGPISTVLYGNAYDPFLKYDLDLMVGLNKEAQEALVHMANAVRQAENFVCLNPGDLIIVDNRRAIHGRTKFIPRYDGKDRWLQRMFVVRDLALTEVARHRAERIIHTEFESIS